MNATIKTLKDIVTSNLPRVEAVPVIHDLLIELSGCNTGVGTSIAHMCYELGTAFAGVVVYEHAAIVISKKDATYTASIRGAINYNGFTGSTALEATVKAEEYANEMLSPLQVGSIVHRRWGYSMTINEFWVVRSIKGCTVTLEECANREVNPDNENRGHYGYEMAGAPTGKLVTAKTRKGVLRMEGNVISKCTPNCTFYYNHDD